MYRFQIVDLFKPGADWPTNEKTRTFHCPDCGKFVVRASSIAGSPEDGFSLRGPLLDKKCPKCHRDNFELLSFMKRYEMIPSKPSKPRKRTKRTKRTKREPEPMFDFKGGIKCK